MPRRLITVWSLWIFAAFGWSGCGAPRSTDDLTVAAAANLSPLLQELARMFRAEFGAGVTFSLGSTAQLAQQIEAGAPFDLFLAADAAHIDDLIRRGLVAEKSRRVYAVGKLALWFPDSNRGTSLPDLKRAAVRSIAVAKPELAPYGQAAIEALRNAGLLETVRSKIVYANNIAMAKQYAVTGNADAAFLAYSLVLRERGSIIEIDPSSHARLEQVAGIPAPSSRKDAAQKFLDLLTSSKGQKLLQQYGYKPR